MESRNLEVARQYLASVVANIGFFSIGNMIGYSSAAGVLLVSEETSDVVLTLSEVGFFAGLLELGSFIGTIIGSIGLRKLGRKSLIIAASFIGLMGWIIIGFSYNKSVLMLGQTGCGTLYGMMMVANPAYTAEIASPEIRGKIGCIPFLVTSFGITFSAVVAKYIKNWRNLARVFATVPIMHIVCMLFNYETPTYLLMRGQEEEAKTVLQKLRGSSFDITPELEETVRLVERTKEFNSSMVAVTKLRRPEVYKPFIICFSYTFLSTWAGFQAVSFNMELILVSAGSLLKDYVNEGLIIYGILRVPSSFLAVLLADKLGRKKLIIGSGSLMGLFLAVFGLYFAVFDFENLSYQLFAWTCLLLAMFFGLIYTMLPFLIQSELLTPDCREFCGFCITAFYSLSGSLNVWTFFPLQSIVSVYVLYWIYAAFCLAGVFFTAIYIPETKGKSIETINNHFQKSSTKDDKKSTSYQPYSSVKIKNEILELMTDSSVLL